MLFFLSTLLGGMYVGWNIGANDTANCMGTSVGSGLIPYKKAVLLVAVFVIIGASLQGHYVMKTIGKGIVTERLSNLAVIIALLSAGGFVTLATYLKLPVSTSQAIVGGITGVGFGFGANVDLTKLASIVGCWVISPILTISMSYALCYLLALPTRWIKRIRVWERVIGIFLICTICYLAYSLGANHAGNAMGPIANLGMIDTRWLVIGGGLSIAFGALTYGRRVSETVGKSITLLHPISACAAQLSAAIAIHLFSVLGIPVSTSQAIVGAVIGVGLVKGIRTVNKKMVARIVIGWIATPTVVGLVSFSLYKFLTL